ncbi:MAG: T9SS type B sorting domain-containing protein [Lutibacter sp.]|uniref:T9SS type B sorting domain-containing protein n=1 Tax=Lutibacter sp. TaxID=1925666 RepID=UPI001802753B|nr:T9SS type B sorting domain-containing protein [Lutibacter sp.]MBT8317871.1 T9SS type B sorting domain-containing protein [Lutibacter sp.]NNJ58729.1 T9SS type B sorting domain-containing protein [Lutibacter sp.]
MKRLVLFLFFLTPLLFYSQNEAAIWYFGENAGLDFNSGTPVVLTDGELNTAEGCASISDASGNLLFYTDGITVWDKTHTIMTNGNGLRGDSSSSQSAIIIPKPNNTNQFYIFTVDDNPGGVPAMGQGINYSIVDMTLRSGLGDITTTKNINILPWAFEKIAATKHADNNSYWIITFRNNQFIYWRLDAGGLSTANTFTTTLNTTSSIGYLKISPNGTKIACANYGIDPNMMLYDFDNSTGFISNELKLDLDELDDTPYGVEFSLQTNKLYVSSDKLTPSGRTLPSKIVQYDLTVPTPLISGTRTLIYLSNTYYRGALQLALDGKIYHALSLSQGTSQIGSNYLGVINNPELDGISCFYEENKIDVTQGGAFPTHKVVEGLPPFLSSYFLDPSISTNNVCQGELTTFNIFSTTPINSVEWIFGDGNTSIESGTETQHIYTAPGIYTVTTNIDFGGVITTLQIDVNIYPLPIITTPVNITLCDDDLDGLMNFNLNDAKPLLSSNYLNETFTYFLSQNDAINNVNPIANPLSFSNATASSVWARIVNSNNCFTTAQINLEVVSINIPSNLMLPFNQCDDLVDGNDLNGITTFDFSSATSQILNALLPQTNLTVTYYQSINDALAQINQIDPTNFRNTTSPFNQQIVVRVDSLTDSCFGVGVHVTLNVDPVPVFNLDSSIDFCLDGSTHTIGIQNPIEIYTYVWEDSSGIVIGNTPSVNVNSQGLYTVTATKTDGTNCVKSKSIQVNMYSLPIITTPVNITSCDDDLDGIMNFNLNDAKPLLSSNYLNETFTYFLSQNDAINNVNPIVNPLNFSNATAASVWARIVNSNNCFTTAQINLEVVSINISSNLMLPFNQCDDLVDGNDLNGITTFDFSSATSQILNSLLPQTNLTVTYYQSINDALAQINQIDPTNFRKTTSPFNQQIVVRVDHNVIDCFKIETLISLYVDPVPVFDLADSQDFCFLSLSYEIGIENPADIYEYLWVNEQNEFLGDTPSINISQSGIYKVTAINQNNCIKTKNIKINSIPTSPLLNFDKNNIVLKDNSVNNSITVLTTNLPISTYEFSIDNFEFSLNNYFDNLQAGLHTVKIRDVENCLEASIDVSVINIPNFFTPNGDGYNDTWHVSGIKFQPTSNIYIFNRFGKLLAILNPLGTGWNGYYNGNPLPSTDYWYRVELDDSRVIKGHFSLIRR